MLATSLLSFVLLALAGVLLDAHRRDWDGVSEAEADPTSWRFARSRFLRRRLASGLIAVVGVLVAVWPVTPREPFWVVLYTASLLTLAAVIFVLGVRDAFASGSFYRAESRRRLREHAEALSEVLREHQEASRSTNDCEASRA